MRLWTILNVFDEAKNLPRCVKSVEDEFFQRVEYITHVFIDGAYKDYNSPHRVSTDGTREFAEQHGVLLTCSDQSECDKRNAALRYIDHHAQRGDWLLYLDADETITEVYSWPQRVGVFSFQRASSVTPREYDRARLYRWEPGLEFAGRHYKLHDAAGELVAGLCNAPQCDPVGFGVHYDKAHDPVRRKVKRAYYTVLSEEEAGVPA